MYGTLLTMMGKCCPSILFPFVLRLNMWLICLWTLEPWKSLVILECTIFPVWHNLYLTPPPTILLEPLLLLQVILNIISPFLQLFSTSSLLSVSLKYWAHTLDRLISRTWLISTTRSESLVIDIELVKLLMGTAKGTTSDWSTDGAVI
jgi:hypothetical protein